MHTHTRTHTKGGCKPYELQPKQHTHTNKTGSKSSAGPNNVVRTRQQHQKMLPNKFKSKMPIAPKHINMKRLHYELFKKKNKKTIHIRKRSSHTFCLRPHHLIYQSYHATTRGIATLQHRTARGKTLKRQLLNA